MKTIQEQMDLERVMLHMGGETYSKSNVLALNEGRGSETTYARRLMQEFMEPLMEALQRFLDNKHATMQGRVRPLLRLIPSENAIFFGLKCVFNGLIEQQSPTQTAIDIGRYIEDDIRFRKFQKDHKDYYDKIIQDFKRKGTTDYRFMHRVMTHSANEHDDKWQTWAQLDRVSVGMCILNIILEGTDLIKKRTIYLSTGKTPVVLEPTDKTLDWINKHEEFHKLLNPGRLPCIIPPDDWIDVRQGGYYSPELRSATPFLVTHDKKHKQLLKDTDLTKVFDAANKIQKTAWQVNSRVLEIAKVVWSNSLQIGMPGSEEMVPPPSPVTGVDKDTMTSEQEAKLLEWKREAAEVYTKERERRAKGFQTARIMRLANQYSFYEDFWYVWYSDFRGRLYTATAGFSPQGPDLAKGLLRLAKGKELSERGWYWLRVHGANRFGYDKCSFDQRAEWVDQQHETFMAAADDPLSHRDVWANADKPYQFLAFLFEYREASIARTCGHTYFSHLAIGMDGSCNGLQNFSAMLLDYDGGKATNLVPQLVPADIYTNVGRVCSDKLALLDFDPLAVKWQEFIAKYGKGGALPRAISKRPVMTLPYGATRQSCTKYIYEAILDIDRDFFEANFAAACWLTPLLWEAIGNVVVAARDAMHWLQVSAGKISKVNEPIVWHTPDNFPVFLSMKKIEKMEVQTQLGGRFRCTLGNFTADIDSRRQRTGVSPNFVHSIDATHLRETVRCAWEKGIKDFALIHDDYGTHASDIDTLHECLREAFVNIYERGSPLVAFKEEHGDRGFKLPALPERGTLDIHAVRDSKYFFS